MSPFSRRAFGCLAAIGWVALSVSGPALAQPRKAAPLERKAPVHTLTGHQVEAPEWSFACMTDHGPMPCHEPMWVYE
jgi:hypothetical protein